MVLVCVDGIKLAVGILTDACAFVIVAHDSGGGSIVGRNTTKVIWRAQTRGVVARTARAAEAFAL